MDGKSGSSDRAQQIAAEASSGQGADEHANERTSQVRERARAGGNAGMSRISERDASGGRGSRARLRITQTRSTISHIARNRATIKALGLHGIGSTSEVPDNDAIRGMVRQVRFLVSVDEIVDGAGTSGSRSRAGGHSESRGSAGRRSESRGDAPASHRSEDSEDSEEKE